MSQWFYTQGEQRRGPVAIEQLNELAAAGVLDPSDLVWKEGMAEWLSAGAADGLTFPQRPRGINLTPGSQLNGQGGEPSLAGRFKAAAQLTANEAQRARFTRITLPGVYKALGKHLYGAGTYRQDFPDFYDQLDNLSAALQAMREPSTNQPGGQGFTAKAKAAAVAAKEFAQAKVLEMRSGQTFANLGEAVFGKHGETSGPAEFVGPIRQVQSQLQALDAEIGLLSKSKPGQLLTPKYIAMGGIAAIVLIGAFLVFRPFRTSSSPQPGQPTVAVVNDNKSKHPDLPDPRKVDRQKVEPQLVKADKFWDDGKQADAVQIYAILIEKYLGNLDEYETNRAFSRTIDFEAKENGPEAAKHFIKRVVGLGHVYLTLTNPEAKALYAKERENPDNDWGGPAMKEWIAKEQERKDTEAEHKRTLETIKTLQRRQ